jgi:hypothetical protein
MQGICEIHNSRALKNLKSRGSWSTDRSSRFHHFSLGFDESVVIECIAESYSIEYDREAYRKEFEDDWTIQK